MIHCCINQAIHLTVNHRFNSSLLELWIPLRVDKQQNLSTLPCSFLCTSYDLPCMWGSRNLVCDETDHIRTPRA